MSEYAHTLPSQRGVSRRSWARGFTLVSLAVSTAISGILLAGGWMSYSSMLRQWKIGNAERQMDQYAASVMQEFTNDLSWSWGAVQLQGGTNARWKFVFDDLVHESGSMSLTRFGRLRDASKFVTFSYQPTQGLLIRGQVPPWAGDRWHPQYRFTGTTPHRNNTLAFDRRDRMTMESLQIDFTPLDADYDPGSLQGAVKWHGIVTVSMVMHYTYSGNGDLGLYGRYYTRERRYSTQVFMKNWDVEGNAFRDSLVARAG